MVVKLERAGADMATAFTAIGMSELAEAAGLRAVGSNKQQQQQQQQPSSTARLLFSGLTHSLAVDLFETYRIDHELFGYDPLPYIILAKADSD